MFTYTIIFRNHALKQMKKIPRRINLQFKYKIEKIRDYENHHIQITKLTGQKDIYRIRQGDYRLIFKVDNSNNTIIVLNVSHRKDAYNN